MKKRDDSFTQAASKFVTGDEPVIGWVKMSAPIDRNRATPIERAVVIGDNDRKLLKELRKDFGASGVLFDDGGKRVDELILALLDRLIGR